MIALLSGLSSFWPSLIVASTGRSGSTLVYDALVDGLAKARFGLLWRMGRKITRGTAWNLGETRLNPGVVYKTHALAEDLPANASVRIVFVYSRPSEVVLSTISCRDRYGQSWLDDHLRHMGVTAPFERLPYEDILRLEEQIDGWTSVKDHELLAVQYDELWAGGASAVSNFVGFPVCFPEKRARKSSQYINDTQLEKIVRMNYKRLDDKITAIAGNI